MGDRGQVQIVDEDVWLYTHSGATYLVAAIYRALARNRDRWESPGQLASAIFMEMIEGSMNYPDAFSIQSKTGGHSDIWRLVRINCATQYISVTDHGETTFNGSFEMFLRDKDKKWREETGS